MRHKWIRALAGAAVGLALVGGGAAVLADTQPGTTAGTPSGTATGTYQSRLQAFLSDLAGRLGVSTSTLQSAIEGAEVDQVNQAVAAGRISQQQAQAIEARIQSGKIGMFGAFGRFGGGMRHPRPFMGLRLKAAADYLGLTPAQLRADLRSGQSLAQVANSEASQGKSVQGLEQALLAPVQARLDKAVQNGKLTAAREQAILARLQARIGDMVNRTWTQNGGWTQNPNQGGASAPSANGG